MSGAAEAAARASAEAAARRSHAIRANIASAANEPALIAAVQQANKDYYAAREYYHTLRDGREGG